MSLYNVVKNFVDEAYKKNGKTSAHFEGTVKWIKKLNPNASEALLIAGYSHDIDRGVSEKAASIKRLQEGGSFVDESYLETHQIESAEAISGFLAKQNADTDLVDRVFYLVSHHEIGGDEEADILKDSDSLSFFEDNIELMIKFLQFGVTKEQLKEKIDWMYNRITSEKAKEYCEPFYEKAISKLSSQI